MESIHLALPPDDEPYQELLSTTETRSDSGKYVAYHPAKRDQDHNLSSLCCIVMAIVALGDGDEGNESDNGMGWVDLGDSGWKPPWG